MNNVLRVDWRPSASDSFYFTFKDWYSDQRGSEITAGPAKWGFFNTHYLNTDRGVSANYTKILRSNLVIDTDFGIRQQTEQFYPLTDADWTRIDRDNGRLHAGAVPSGAQPAQCRAQSEFQRAQRAQLHVRQPPGRSGRRVAVVDPEQPDVDPRQPLLQERVAISSSRATRKATAASAPGRGPASSRSTPTPTTPSTPTTATPTRSSAPSTTTRRSTSSPRSRDAATSPSSTCRTRGRPAAG